MSDTKYCYKDSVILFHKYKTENDNNTNIIKIRDERLP